MKADAPTRKRLAEIGEQLRVTRRSLGVSRADVADRLGMHKMNYARIEQGKQNVTVETLLRISEALGAELTVRFEGPKP